MRTGAAGAGEVDQSQAVPGATRILQQAADGGDLSQHGCKFVLVAKREGEAAFQPIQQDTEARETLHNTGGGFRDNEATSAVLQMTPMQPRDLHMLALAVEIAAGNGEQQKAGDLAQQPGRAIEQRLQRQLPHGRFFARLRQRAHNQCPDGAGACWRSHQARMMRSEIMATSEMASPAVRPRPASALPSAI